MNVSRCLGLFAVTLLALAFTGCKHSDDAAVPDDSFAPQPVAQRVVSGLQEPVSLVFLSKTSWLVAERRSGRILWIENGKLRPAPFATIPVPTSPESSGGLLGLAVDSAYPTRPFVYARYTDPSGSTQRVVRFTVKDGIGVDPLTVIDGLPGGGHDGGRLLFGPDEKLYVTLGDANHPDLVQGYDKLPGKVLRYNPDGSIPPDNPMELAKTGWAGNANDDSKQLDGEKTPVYTIGHRDPCGIASNPETGELYITDTGPDHNDAILHLVAGDNYGWPDVSGISDDPHYRQPLWASGQKTLAPTGMAFYSGSALPQFHGNLIFASASDGKLRRAIFDGIDKITAVEDIPEADANARLDVAMGPDGDLYFTSMDSIYRLTVQK